MFQNNFGKDREIFKISVWKLCRDPLETKLEMILRSSSKKVIDKRVTRTRI